ncbi:MAG: MBL fold metallo-hydrolase [Anaerolineae bacterium]|nr:MBL fold metallo-hydrolase [Anaerolineae bacterium]
MRLRIWGARGSIPTPITTPEMRRRLHEVLVRSQGVNLDSSEAIDRFLDRLPASLTSVVSGNTSCFEVRAGEQLFIFDLGSGSRLLGKALMQEEFGQGQGTAHIFISHTHWDHIEGFPFFTPAYVPGNQLHFYTPFEDIEWRLRQLMGAPFFPVELDYPQATRSYHTLKPGHPHQINDVQIEMIPLHHPGTSYAYKLQGGGKTLVYANDAEYPQMDQQFTAPYEDFFRGADVLIFDAMYTYEAAVTSKVDWGHSTPKAGAELAWRAGVKRLILTHHDPEDADIALWSKIEDADQHIRFRNTRTSEERPLEVLLATEGLTLEI